MTSQLFQYATIAFLIASSFSCSAKKFSSSASDIQIAAYKESIPEISKSLNQAMQEIANAKLANDEDLTNTNWKLAGYHEMLSTTNGAGQIIALIPTGNFTFRFGLIDEATCPDGFYCATVIRKHIDSIFATSCGAISLRSYHAQIYDLSGQIQSNIQISKLQDQSTSNSCATETDRLILEKIKWLYENGQVLIKKNGNVLYVQILSSTFVFVK